MATFTNILNCAGRNYRTKAEAENRMSRAEAAHKDTEVERMMAGRGPFTTKTAWKVEGDENQGYYVLETITK